MVNVTKLERDTENIILNLSTTEKRLYMDSLNKKIVDCYSTPFKSHMDIEEHNKLVDVSEVLIHLLRRNQYDNVESNYFHSKSLALIDKYFKETSLARYKIQLYTIDSLYTKLNLAFFTLKELFMIIHNYNNNILNNLLMDIRTLNPNVDLETNMRAKYEVNIDRSLALLNNAIKNHMSIMNAHIESLDYFTTYDLDSVEESEENKETINQYVKIYNDCLELINKYETYIANPFENSVVYDILIHYSITFKKDTEGINTFEELEKYKDSLTVEEEKQYLEHKINYNLQHMPTYDFQEFKLTESNIL